MSQLISHLFLLVFAAGAVGLVVWMALAIARNFRAGREFRARLSHRLQTMRMHRMAKALGIDVEHCLHDETIVRIEENMRRCESCAETERCDQALAREKLSTAEIEFCPNRDCLVDYVEASGERAAI